MHPFKFLMIHLVLHMVGSVESTSLGDVFPSLTPNGLMVKSKIHTYIHTYTHTHIHTYTHTHITFIPFHSIPLHYSTLHYITLHTCIIATRCSPKVPILEPLNSWCPDLSSYNLPFKANEACRHVLMPVSRRAFVLL